MQKPQPLPRGAALLPLGAWILYSVFALRARWIAATVAGVALHLLFAAFERRRAASLNFQILPHWASSSLDWSRRLWRDQGFSSVTALSSCGWLSRRPDGVRWCSGRHSRFSMRASPRRRSRGMRCLCGRPAGSLRVWCCIFTANLAIVLLSAATGHPLLIGSLAPLGSVTFGFVFTGRYTRKTFGESAGRDAA